MVQTTHLHLSFVDQFVFGAAVRAIRADVAALGAQPTHRTEGRRIAGAFVADAASSRAITAVDQLVGFRRRDSFSQHRELVGLRPRAGILARRATFRQLVSVITVLQTVARLSIVITRKATRSLQLETIVDATQQRTGLVGVRGAAADVVVDDGRILWRIFRDLLLTPARSRRRRRTIGAVATRRIHRRVQRRPTALFPKESAHFHGGKFESAALGGRRRRGGRWTGVRGAAMSRTDERVVVAVRRDGR